MSPPSASAPADDPFLVELPSAPYPGLRPFEKQEWPVFFGRETMTAEVIDRLLNRRWLLVHGDSGCGKSSLIRAGVQAQLEQEQARSGREWITVDMRPGDAPLQAMAEALARDGKPESVQALRRALNRGRSAASALEEAVGLADSQRLCLLVDQFEELFRFAIESDGQEAHLFTDVLVGWEASPPPGWYLVLTMRSEFLGHCARYEGLAEAVNRGQYLLPRMDRAGLVRAIREPAKLYGGEIAADLADALIAAAGGGQDQLPLIQHGLMRLWTGTAPDSPGPGAHPPSRCLGIADYPAEHGLAGLLSDHADTIMESVAPPGDEQRQRWVEYLFRALTELNADGHALRRPQTFRALVAVTGAQPAALRPLIDAFRAEGASFLTPYGDTPIVDDTRIDVGHEALIRCWRRIADPDPRSGWLQREFKDGRTWQTLRIFAEGYREDPDKVLSPAATLDLSDWFHKLPSPEWCERYGGGYAEVQSLLAGSEAALERERAEAEDKRRLEQKLRIIKLRIVVGFVILMWTILIGFAYTQYKKADSEREEATRQRREVETQSQRLAQTETELKLQNQATATATSPDGKFVASIDASGNLYVRELNTGQRVPLSSTCEQTRPDVVVFSPSGNAIAIASGANTYILDLASHDCHFLGGYDARVRRVAFSPDGHLLATGTDFSHTAAGDVERMIGGNCRIWNVKSGELVRTLPCPFTVIDIAFDASGKRLICKGSEGSTIEWTSHLGDFRDAAQPSTTAAELSPRLYVHIQSETNRLAAAAWQTLIEQSGVIVPGIEMVGKKSPSKSELRYFRQSEEAKAQQIVEELRRSGAEVKLTYLRGYEDSKQIRPLHFELWFADDAIGYWFPVVGSFHDRERAIAAVQRIQRSPTAQSYDVQLYRATDAKGLPIYAVTLGGYLTEAEAQSRVADARKQIEPSAYVRESRIWQRENF